MRTNYTKNVYLTERLRNKLKPIRQYPLSIITAPPGYGKTTAVQVYFNYVKLPHVWLNHYSDNINDFWLGVCNIVGRFNNYARDKLLDLGFPTDCVSRREFVCILSGLTQAREYYLVIDDFHFIASIPGVPELLQIVLQEFRDTLHIIILTRVQPPSLSKITTRTSTYQITAEDLTLRPDDIRQYFARYNVMLSTKQAEQIYADTAGWFILLSLYTRSYLRYGEIREAECRQQVTLLFESEIYSTLDTASRNLALSLCMVDQFTNEQALYFDPESAQIINLFWQKNAFLHYDSQTDTYGFHPVLRQCFQAQFKRLPSERQNYIYSKLGSWYYNAYDLFHSAKFYCLAHDYSAMLSAIAQIQVERLTSGQKTELLHYFSKCPRQLCCINPKAEITIAQIAIKQDMPSIYRPLLNELPADIASAPAMTRDDKYSLYCLLELLLGTLENDINENLIHYIKAYKWYEDSHFTEPSPLPEGTDCLSTLFQIIRNDTQLDSIIEPINQIYSFYNDIAKNNQAGIEDFFAAEINYNRCNILEAEIALNKCMAKASAQRNLSLCLKVQFISLRLCGITGQVPSFRGPHKLIRKNHPFYQYHLDIIEGFLYALFEQPYSAASWLVEEEMDKIDLYEPMTPIVRVVHCALLYARGDYTRMISTSERYLEDKIDSGLYRQYLNILLAAANYAVGRSLIAKDYIRTALQIAARNGIYMPFVEFGDAVMPLLDCISSRLLPSDTHKTIQHIYCTFEASKHRLQKQFQNHNTDTLTMREHQIASLASTGLTNRQIADQLFITENTVKSALKSIFCKLNIKRREEIIWLMNTDKIYIAL